jgi:hypothetical protein
MLALMIWSIRYAMRSLENVDVAPPAALAA